jgi:hypothetical protein
MVFGTCSQTAAATPHVHDEWFIVVEACYRLVIDGKRIPVRAGEEDVIPGGPWQGGEPQAGTRTIHVFGGRRAARVREA